MLSGISQKHSIRSNPYWFTEFCNSQCLSHFAAPFIVVRAETSVAESCNEARFGAKAPAKLCTEEQDCQKTPDYKGGSRPKPASAPAALEMSPEAYNPQATLTLKVHMKRWIACE